MLQDAVAVAPPPAAPERFDEERVQSLVQRMVARESWPRARLLAYQQRRLRATVAHAVTHSRYYRETLGDAGRGEVRLAELPLLTKSTLMREFDGIVTDPRLRLADIEAHLASERLGELLPGGYRAFATGGSTGQRGVFVYDAPAWEASIANLVRWTRASGVTPSSRLVTIGAPSPLHITNRVSAELGAGRADAPRLAVTTPLAEVVEALNACRPEALLTYPSFIRRLAEEQFAGRLRISPSRLLSAAEVLTRDVRALASDAWGADVADCYGSTEAALMGSECRHAAGIHIAEDLIVLEVVNSDNRPVPPGTVGDKLLVTTLFNRLLPLIRYELSDRVAVKEGSCACGRPHRRLAVIEGRREDVLSLPARDGGRVDLHPVQLCGQLLRVAAVRQFQFAATPGGLALRVVLRDRDRADALGEILRIVRSELDRAGAAVGSLAIEPVERIEPSGPAAKERLVASAG